MITNMEQIKQLLEERGVQPSHQRVRILQCLIEKENHPSVLELYEQISREIPTLSKTTVYNTLNALVEKGLVTALPLTSDEMRYDHNTDAHHHFLCRKCRRIIDIDVKCAYARLTEIAGHRIEAVYGHFRGVCKECSETNGTPDDGAVEVLQKTKNGG
jgi:Fe2+ or Zn2+ uptake regulation protein